MTTLKYLELSTAHITQETAMEIELRERNPTADSAWPAMTIATHQHGSFLTVPEEIRDMPDDLMGVMQRAQKQGCYLVRFDADAEVLADLNTYDW